ncbi:hypothetical protein VP01_3019g1 [Puccinia sorghi]|uniref:Uncharacterized protein n=1 Tax=Puccinia sorghi TaxID=27349 RepID=A0A0L6V053_9BASI|nr:hypothetical protein VP01_3019g1 [Puccinia sorghi]
MSDQSQETVQPQEDLQVSTGPSGSAGSIPTLNVEPLHHPTEMAHIEVPHNVENIPHGTTAMNGKTLMAKKMAAAGTSFYSPSDSLVSPCTQKLSSQKGKRWANSKSAPPSVIISHLTHLTMIVRPVFACRVKPIVFGKSNLNTTSHAFLDEHEPTSLATDSTESGKDHAPHAQ